MLPAMKIAYLDCLSGISGDMTLGALIDAGVDPTAIQAGLDSLGLPMCQLVVEETTRHGFRAINVQIQHEEEHSHRHLHHITEMINNSDLTTSQKELATRIFQHLAEAEARVHNSSIEKVHFHEVGAVDSIADVVGSAIGWDLLGADRIICSPVPTGHGFITIAHGRVSLPAPATAELLKNVPLAECPVQAELTTPTGAAIAVTVAEQFGPLPAMKVETVGYGAGDRDLSEQPNVLRLLVGEQVADAQSNETTRDQVWVLETNLDDISGEVIGHCTELLLNAGALDVYSTAIQMKKNRPGTKLTVLCGEAEIPPLEQILFRETATLGIRRWPADRHKLVRSIHHVETSWGTVAGKLAVLEDGSQIFSPEYEACREISQQQKIPLHQVYQAATMAFNSKQTSDPA